LGSFDAIAAALNNTQNVPMLHLEDVLFTGVVVDNLPNVHHHGAGTFGYKVRYLRDELFVVLLFASLSEPLSQ
jgi:hypothetical protein